MTSALALSSCQKELQGGDGARDGAPGVKLLFSLGGIDTKAGLSGTIAGVETLHENDINTIDYFLYPTGSTGNALVHGHVTADDIAYSNSRDGQTLINAPCYSVNVGDGMLRSLFSGGAVNSTCDVYVIANYPGTLDHTGNTSLSYLKDIVVSTTFKDTTPTEFVMDGEALAVMYDRSKTDAAEGIVPMKRVASKVTLEVHCVRRVDVENTIISGEDTLSQIITWTPMLSIMKANLCMGKQQGKIGGGVVTNAPTFKYTKTDMTVGDNDTTYHSIPFYSYPCSWHNGDEDAPYIKLELPWRNGSTQKQFYYKIPLPGQVLEKNNWYHIVLNVAIIGGEDFEAGVEVSGQYYIVPWETQLIIQAEAEIVDARYLTVPSRSYTLYNQEDLEFIFTSSHDCVIKDVTFTKPNYSGQTVTTTTLVNKQGNNNAATSFSLGTGVATDVLKVEERTINFHHALNNVIGAGLDVAPYTLTFTICHEDAMDTYLETITVIQEPAISIQVIPNEGLNTAGCTYVNNGNGGWLISSSSYYNNNSTQHRQRYECYLGTNPDGLSGARNPNMYRIKTSVLGESDFIVGDPRSSTIDNLPASGGEWSSTAAAIDGSGNRRLTYYYPTDSSEESMYVISPEFQIASNYGSCQANYYIDAERRCASYQEDGYPAGRWRVPTRAEVEYMIILSQKSLIPQLFSPDAMTNGGYWCGSGVIYPLDDNAGTVEYRNFADAAQYHNNLNWVRCVYDNWYWDNTDYPTIANKTTFTWGDLNL